MIRILSIWTKTNGSDEWEFSLENYPKQEGNDLDCGVFVCLYAKNVVFDLNFKFNQGVITSSRQLIASEIINFEIKTYNKD